MGVPGEVLTEEGQHSGPGEPRHRAWKPECRKRARDPQFWSQSLVVKSLLGATLKQHTAQYLLEEGPGTPGRLGESRARTDLSGRTWGGTGPQTAGLSGRDCLQLQLQAGPWRPTRASPRAPARDRERAAEGTESVSLHLTQRRPEAQSLGAALPSMPPPTKAGEGASVTDRGPGRD